MFRSEGIPSAVTGAPPEVFPGPDLHRRRIFRAEHLPQVASTASRAVHGLAAAPSSGSHMSSFRMTDTMCL